MRLAAIQAKPKEIPVIAVAVSKVATGATNDVAQCHKTGSDGKQKRLK
jgi:hypothetical protein